MTKRPRREFEFPNNSTNKRRRIDDASAPQLKTQMPNLVDPITFDMLIAELTEEEWSHFVSTLPSSIQPSNLSSQRKPTLTAVKQSDCLHSSITILTRIIHSRTAVQSTQANTRSIDQLSESVIGVIASYLDQKDYGLFERSNRSIYIACNTPNQLQTIDLIETGPQCHSSIALLKYPSANIFKFDGRYLNKLHIAPVFNSMATQLTFMNLIPKEFDHRQFINFFCKFPRIQMLEMIACSGLLQSPESDDLTGVCLPKNITKLRLESEGALGLWIMATYANQIQELQLYSLYYRDLRDTLNVLQFPQLQYLKINEIECDNTGKLATLKSILSNAPKLRKFEWRAMMGDGSNEIQVFEQVFQSLMVHTTLENAIVPTTLLQCGFFFEGFVSALLNEEIAVNKGVTFIVDIKVVDPDDIVEQDINHLITTFCQELSHLSDALKARNICDGFLKIDFVDGIYSGFDMRQFITSFTCVGLHGINVSYRGKQVLTMDI